MANKWLANNVGHIANNNCLNTIVFMSIFISAYGNDHYNSPTSPRYADEGDARSFGGSRFTLAPPTSPAAECGKKRKRDDSEHIDIGNAIDDVKS